MTLVAVDFGKKGQKVISFDMVGWPTFCGGRILSNFCIYDLKDYTVSGYNRPVYPLDKPLTPEQLRGYIIEKMGVTGSLIMADRKGNFGDEYLFPLFEKDFDTWNYSVKATDSDYYTNRVHSSKVRHISLITAILPADKRTTCDLPGAVLSGAFTVVRLGAGEPAPAPPAPRALPVAAPPPTGIRWPAPPDGRPLPKKKAVKKAWVERVPPAVVEVVERERRAAARR